MRRSRALPLALALCSTACTIERGFRTPATPERPTVSSDTLMTAEGTLELETGLSIDPDDRFGTPSTLKYGLDSRSELFLGFEPWLAAAMDAGDRLTPLPASRASCRPTARVAPRDAACSAARSSFHANGCTAMPRSTATVTVVVKDSTSTTTAYAAPSAIASAPVGPHSNRTGHPAWR